VAFALLCYFAINFWGAWLLGVPKRLALLLGVGNSVCGNTAIAATAPVIGAEPREVSFAMTTITILGTASVFIYPVVAAVSQLPAVAYGAWCGVAINDTSQVIAASTVLGPLSLQTATIVKLIRNALMAPLIVVIGWREAPANGSELPGLSTVVRAVPPFVLAFFFVAGLRSADIISPEVAAVLGETSHWAILIALAGVGLGTALTDLRTIGYKPFIVSILAVVIVSLVSFGGLLLVK
jgi:uncharacterized integral membrane protein (TIGR00698 family)